MGQFYILKIELDGHFRGGDPVKPWVAQITGPDRKYGLARSFISAKNDWKDAHRAQSGNVYGRVACFPLRDGNLYEVQRCRGTSSKRRVVREFLVIEGGKRVALEPIDALARVGGGEEACALTLPNDSESWVARLTGLGMPDPVAFATVDDGHLYRLRNGVYEVSFAGERRFAGVSDGQRKRLSEQEAWEWLHPSTRSA